MPRFLVCVTLVVACSSPKNAQQTPASTTPVPAASAAPPPPIITPSSQGCPLLVMPCRSGAAAAIQSAIDQAANGDCSEILLPAGEFELSEPLRLRTNVKISGQRFRNTFTVLRPTKDFSGRALLNADFDPSTKERKRARIHLEALHLRGTARCEKKDPCYQAEVGLWLDKTPYPVIRECHFSEFPATGAGIRGGGVMFLRLEDSSFTGIFGWAVDLAVSYASPREGGTKPSTYYAVSVGDIVGNYLSSRRGLRIEPAFAVNITRNQFEGGISMIHAYETPSSRLDIESNYFELASTPEDVPGHGAIVLRGTGRVVANLLQGPVKGKEPSYLGPGIEIVGSEAMTIADNTIRCFDPAVSIRGMRGDALTQFGNVIAPRKHVKKAWDSTFLDDKANRIDQGGDD